MQACKMLLKLNRFIRNISFIKHTDRCNYLSQKRSTIYFPIPNHMFSISSKDLFLQNGYRKDRIAIPIENLFAYCRRKFH